MGNNNMDVNFGEQNRQVTPIQQPQQQFQPQVGVGGQVPYETGQFAPNTQAGFNPVNAPMYNAAQVAVQQSASEVVPINMDKATRITTISDMHTYAQGQIVRFPNFGEGQPFVAKVRRPSMLALAKMGKIPNALLASAAELFQQGTVARTKSENLLGDMYDVCKVVCAAAMMEPTWNEIELAGIELSDQQIMAIFNYTQVGVDSLNSFREE